MSCLALACAGALGCTPTPDNTPDGGPSTADAGAAPDSGGGALGTDAGNGSDAGPALGADAGGTSDSGVSGGDSGPGSDSGGPDAAPIVGTGPVPPATLPVVTLSTAAECDITTPTTWTAAVYVINCSNYISVDAALTIDQGTVIKFEPGNYMTVSPSGQVNSLGGSAYPIVYTSFKDDVHGGDTNGDGSASTPAPGDWNGVLLNGTNSSSFRESQFFYSGQGNGALYDSSSAPVTVTNSVFAHNKPTTDAITAPAALDLSSAPAGTVAADNTFYDDRVPLGINTAISLDDSNVFAPPSGQAANEYNAVVVNVGPNLVAHISWTTTKVPFVVAGSYLDVDTTGVLTLGDGVVFKFGAGAWVSVSGVLSSKATTGIVFTSIKDDAHGGDTNADGNATTPASGDWNGVQLNASTGSAFNLTGFYYAGGGSSPALGAGNTAATVTNCTFAHDRTTTDAITANAALDLSNAGASSVVTGNTFYDDRVPLGINDVVSLDDSNTFAAPAGQAGNEYDAIVVNTGPNLTGSVRWAATKAVFVVPSYLEIDATGTLTLGNSVTLKFGVAANAGIAVMQGGALAGGAGDVLTSIRDDAHGGDTNGDGSATTPAKGDWWGISENGQSGLGTTGAGVTCTTSVGTEYYAYCP